MKKSVIIDKDLFTNSLLISPNPNQNSISHFAWKKKHSMFSSADSKTIFNHELFYQCTIFDFLSIIQLHITDFSGEQRKYSFGPIILQKDLFPYVKKRQLIYQAKLILSKKQTFPVTVELGKDEEKNLKLFLEFKNGINITLSFPPSTEEEEYQSLFKIIQPENNQLEICFFKQRKLVAEVLKKLKIYTHEGTFLKLAFNSQIQRDSFLISLLSEAGFEFRKKNQSNLALEKSPSKMTMPILPQLLRESSISPQTKKKHLVLENDNLFDEKTIRKKKTNSTEKVSKKHNRVISEFHQTDSKFVPQTPELSTGNRALQTKIEQILGKASNQGEKDVPRFIKAIQTRKCLQKINDEVMNYQDGCKQIDEEYDEKYRRRPSYMKEKRQKKQLKDKKRQNQMEANTRSLSFLPRYRQKGNYKMEEDKYKWGKTCRWDGM